MFVPSLIRSLDDVILRITYLKLVLDSYVGNKNPLIDEFISPAVASDSLLSQFPPTRIMCAGLDPLRDSSYVFAYRLAYILYSKVKVNIRLIEYSKLHHGFWTISNFVGLNESKDAVMMAIEYIKELVAIV